MNKDPESAAPSPGSNVCGLIHVQGAILVVVSFVRRVVDNRGDLLTLTNELGHNIEGGGLKDDRIPVNLLMGFIGRGTSGLGIIASTDLFQWTGPVRTSQGRLPRDLCCATSRCPAASGHGTKLSYFHHLVHCCQER